MTDEPVDPPAADPPAESGDLPKRVSSLEGKIDRILDMVTGGGGDDNPEHVEPGAPNIAHEIRQQLDQRDREAKKKADEDGVKAELGEVKTKLAELAEKPPAPMPRRIERLMGWS
jgi:hypothetical protein